MAATLVGRAADAQALKALAACKLLAPKGLTLTFAPAADAQAVRAQASSPFATNTVALTTSTGEQLFEPNAVCAYIARLAAAQQSWKVQQWLEWEAACLRPAIYKGGADLDAALKHLHASLGAGPLLTGSAVTLADVSWGSGSFPLKLVRLLEYSHNSDLYDCNFATNNKKFA